ncbi:MAG: GNAT family N-acetyltransferase [Chloroflexi bacterium]|nr:GNAT family N-acetyltransferase [Chloroflexota bacterium]
MSVAAKLRIRAMEPEDIAAVLEIDRKITGVGRALTYTDLITGDLGGVLDLSFVAEVSGQAAGFILARHSFIGEPVQEAALIHIIGIDPAFQHQGIARQLVEALVERCKSRGIKSIRVMVNERDSQLRRFFDRISFRRGQLIEYTKSV